VAVVVGVVAVVGGFSGARRSAIAARAWSTDLIDPARISIAVSFAARAIVSNIGIAAARSWPRVSAAISTFHCPPVLRRCSVVSDAFLGVSVAPSPSIFTAAPLMDSLIDAGFWTICAAAASPNFAAAASCSDRISPATCAIFSTTC
jgi:hypothetical protein